MVSEEDIRRELHAILRECDLDATTEKQIRLQIGARLGASVDDFKQLIKGEVESYLVQLSSQEKGVVSGRGRGGGQGDEDDSGDDEYQAPARGAVVPGTVRCQHQAKQKQR